MIETILVLLSVVLGILQLVFEGFLFIIALCAGVAYLIWKVSITPIKHGDMHGLLIQTLARIIFIGFITLIYCVFMVVFKVLLL